MSSQTGMGRLHLLARSPQAHVIMRRGTAGTGAHGADVDKEPLPEGYQKGFDEGRRQSLAELEPRVRELEAENVRVARQLFFGSVYMIYKQMRIG